MMRASGSRLKYSAVCAIALLLGACNSIPSTGGGQPLLEWVAGNPGSEGNLDGVGTASRFSESLHLHADLDGGVLVADEFASTMRHIDAQGRVTTLAGKSGVNAYQDGAASAARFYWPEDATRAADGTVYIADTQNALIRAIKPDGTVATVAGVPDTDGRNDDTRAGWLGHLKGIARDTQGRLWVSYAYSSALRIVSPDGAVITWQPGNSGCVLSDIVAMTESSEGAIWITDGVNVGRVTPESYAPLTPCANDGRTDDDEITGADKKTNRYVTLAFDRAGQLYAANARNIVALGADGKATITAALPKGYGLTSLAFDGTGRMLITVGEVERGFGSEGIWQVMPDGQVHAYAGADDSKPLPGSADDDFVLAADGTIYYVDRLSDVIFRIAPDGKAELWAGAWDKKGRNDGFRLDARFEYPSGLALDAAGNLYVADSGNALIRRIDLQGNVTTVSGKSSDKNRIDGAFSQATFWRPRYLHFDRDGRLYVLDNSPYISGRDASIRRLDFAAGTVTTVAREAQQFTYENAVRLRDSRRLPSTYEDFAIGPQGQLYVLSGDVVWQIDPASGKHQIHFLPGPWSETETAYYDALVHAKSRSDKDRMDNNLISCDWIWCHPERIAADASGNVYLSDSGNHTITRIDSKGNAAIIAGQLGQRGNQPGALPGALNRPEGMFVTPQGDLLIDVGWAGIMRLRAPAAAAEQVPVPSAPSSSP